jgi:hypothetical protein
LDPAREDEKELPLAGLEPRGAREFTDTVAKPLDGGALSLAGTRTPARGRAAASCLPPSSRHDGRCCCLVRKNGREEE